LLALMMLFPVAMRVIQDFRNQVEQGIDKPVFDPAKFPDLETDPEAWPDAKGPAPVPASRVSEDMVPQT
ncbi:MAG: hypothetical protein AAFW64_11375, partial [Pseudomonadota bacterium]